MTFNQFNELNIEERYRCVWSKGKFIFDRAEENYIINLFSLYTFYCEIKFDPDKNEFVELKSFKNLDRLDPYMDLIKLKFDK